MSIAESSRKKYISKIDLLKNKYDIIDLEKYDDVMKKIGDLSENTIKTYIISIIFWNKEKGTNIKTGKVQKLSDYVLKKYGDRLKEINKKNEDYEDSNEMSKKQSEKMIPWTDVIKKRDELLKKEPASLATLILSIYSFIPPRRLEYAYLLWIDDDNFDDFEEDTEYNYCVYTGKYMYFKMNKYKTVRHIGPIKFKLPKSLEKVILDYVDEKKLKNNALMFGIKDETNFSRRIKKIFEKYFDGKGGSVQIIRHIYATWLHQNGSELSIAEKKKISKLMAHNYLDNQKYSRHKSDEISKDLDKKFNENLKDALDIKIY